MIGIIQVNITLQYLYFQKLSILYINVLKLIPVNVNLYHPNTIYKKHDFECEHDTARKIVDKVNTILDLRNSPCRREYKSVKEKKLQTRTSFNAKHMS